MIHYLRACLVSQPFSEWPLVRDNGYNQTLPNDPLAEYEQEQSFSKQLAVDFPRFGS